MWKVAVGGWDSTLVLGTMPITVSVIVLVKNLKARGELEGSLADKFRGAFLPEGCHPFQPVLGWDVLQGYNGY